MSRRRANPLRGLWALLALTAALGCAATPMPAGYREALGYERQGRHQAALAAFRRALARCTDDSACVALRLRIAETLVRLGRPRAAIREYQELLRVARRGSAKARALHRSGRLHERALRRPDAAALLYRRAIVEHPDEVGAEDSLRDLLALTRRRHGPRAAATLLLELYPKVRGHAVADDLLFSAANIYQRAGRLGAALQLLDRLLIEHPKGPLRDDALWAAGQILETQKRWQAALTRYRRILDGRTYPIIGAGSYNSVYVDDAQLRRALIHYEKLGNEHRALAALALLRDDFRDSRLRDDAQWWIAKIHWKAKRSGRACAALEVLVRRFPDGNHVRRAKAARVRWSCSRVSSTKNKAPKKR